LGSDARSEFLPAMRVTVIHNPGAGDSGTPAGEEIKRMVCEAGHEPAYRSCKSEGWEACLDEPTELIAVAGGDGTVGLVARRLAGRDVPITVLPMGTANNIARSLGLAGTPVEQLVAGWAQGRRAKVDIGAASGPWGRSAFVEGVGAGVFAWTLPQADASRTLASLDRAEDKIVYALELLKERLRRCPAMRVEATLDGRDVSGTYVMFEAMNMRYVGPNLYLAPDGDPGDGRLDVVTVPEADRDRFVDYLSSWQDGRMREPHLPAFRGRNLRMHWGGFAVHLDDRIWPAEDDETPARDSTKIEIGFRGEAVAFLLPPAVRTGRESSA
jgi:diacylglycerol kinase family enzyme